MVLVGAALSSGDICAGLYVASPVEDYLLLIHMGQDESGGQRLSEGEQNLAQLSTRAPLPP